MLNTEYGLRLRNEARIKVQADYQQVFKAHKKIFSQFFVLYYRANSLDYGRLGIIISKKNLRLAVARNKVRRIVRESFRLRQHNLVGLDLVVVAKKSAGHSQRNELQQCLEELWTRLPPLCN